MGRHGTRLGFDTIASACGGFSKVETDHEEVATVYRVRPPDAGTGRLCGVLDFGLGVEPHGPWRLFNRTLNLRRAGMNDHVCDCA